MELLSQDSSIVAHLHRGRGPCTCATEIICNFVEGPLLHQGHCLLFRGIRERQEEGQRVEEEKTEGEQGRWREGERAIEKSGDNAESRIGVAELSEGNSRECCVANTPR